MSELLQGLVVESFPGRTGHTLWLAVPRVRSAGFQVQESGSFSAFRGVGLVAEAKGPTRALAKKARLRSPESLLSVLAAVPGP